MFSIRKIKFNIIDTFFILSKNISITNIFSIIIIIIFRFRINLSINIILLNRIYKISIKITKRNMKFTPIVFIIIIPLTRNKFNNRFSITSSFYTISNNFINSFIFILTIYNISKSISNMFKNKDKPTLIRYIYVLWIISPITRAAASKQSP